MESGPGEHRDRLRGDRLDRLLLGLVSSSSCSPSHSTRKLPVTPLSAWIGDAREDLLALLEAQTLHVEVREADAVGGVRRVLAVVRGHRLGEALEVLGDLARVRHRSGAA